MGWQQPGIGPEGVDRQIIASVAAMPCGRHAWLERRMPDHGNCCSAERGQCVLEAGWAKECHATSTACLQVGDPSAVELPLPHAGLIQNDLCPLCHLQRSCAQPPGLWILAWAQRPQVELQAPGQRCVRHKPSQQHLVPCLRTAAADCAGSTRRPTLSRTVSHPVGRKPEQPSRHDIKAVLAVSGSGLCGQPLSMLQKLLTPARLPTCSMLMATPRERGIRAATAARTAAPKFDMPSAPPPGLGIGQLLRFSTSVPRGPSSLRLYTLQHSQDWVVRLQRGAPWARLAWPLPGPGFGHLLRFTTIMPSLGPPSVLL